MQMGLCCIHMTNWSLLSVYVFSLNKESFVSFHFLFLCVLLFYPYRFWVVFPHFLISTVFDASHNELQFRYSMFWCQQNIENCSQTDADSTCFNSVSHLIVYLKWFVIIKQNEFDFFFLIHYYIKQWGTLLEFYFLACDIFNTQYTHT